MSIVQMGMGDELESVTNCRISGMKQRADGKGQSQVRLLFNFVSWSWVDLFHTAGGTKKNMHHLRIPGMMSKHQQTKVAHGFKLIQDFVHPQYQVWIVSPLRLKHGCCWETFYIFSYCGSVGNPTT